MSANRSGVEDDVGRFVGELRHELLAGRRGVHADCLLGERLSLVAVARVQLSSVQARLDPRSFWTTFAASPARPYMAFDQSAIAQSSSSPSTACRP